MFRAKQSKRIGDLHPHVVSFFSLDHPRDCSVKAKELLHFWEMITVQTRIRDTLDRVGWLVALQWHGDLSDSDRKTQRSPLDGSRGARHAGR